MGEKISNSDPVYIMQIHASKYFKAFTENKDHIVLPDNLTNYRKVNGKEIPDKTLYISTMPDSLELRFLCRHYKNEFYDFKASHCATKKRTDMIVDVVFDKPYLTKGEISGYKKDKNGEYSTPYAKPKVKESISKIRTELYENGMNLSINGRQRHYVFYQRGAAKVKNGHCMFIDERYIEEVNKWAFMGLDFTKDKHCDLTSLLAYRSLVTSSVIGTIPIKRKEILLISDIAPEFETIASVTKYDESTKSLYAKTDNHFVMSQELFDGQSLLDVSKFTGAYAGQGCLLLRNKFFKSCAFNTNLQSWFKDHDTETVTDMFGHKHKASDIMLITTPNSLKALKFAYKCVDGKGPQDNKNLTLKQKYKMYSHWQSDIDSEFGIVKFEKPSHFKPDRYGNARNQLSYQMINSLPLSQSEIDKLCENSIRNIVQMRDDYSTFSSYLQRTKGVYGSSSVLSMLCNINEDVQYTDLYRKHKKVVVDKMKDRVKEGKIIVRADNCTMVSNPIDMLRHAIGRQISDDMQDLGDYEICTLLYRDGEDLAGFRSPHIASGNVCTFRNKHSKIIMRYLNLTKNIVVVRAYKNDVLARLQGADCDSDFLFLTNDKIILSAAKKCKKFATPINDIEGTSKYPAYNMKKLAKMDQKISNNVIGPICNAGQLLNCYYWDKQSKNASEDTLSSIYNSISMLSSLSQIEIDSAKKSFPLNVPNELRAIKNNSVIEKSTKKEKRKVMPIKRKNRIDIYIQMLKKDVITTEEFDFLKTIEESYTPEVIVQSKLMRKVSPRKDSIVVTMDAPMDKIIESVNHIPRARKTTNRLELKSLMVDKPKGDAESRKIKEILEIADGVRGTQHDQNKKVLDENTDYEESTFERKVAEIKKIEISQVTMYTLICRAYGPEEGHLKADKSLTDYRKVLLDLLAAAHPDVFCSCFKVKK